ncbi:MAG: ABC transporter permease [Trueperaceae bacterium]|nr:ABC transporter permease [Trueperaceae bacterium]
MTDARPRSRLRRTLARNKMLSIGAALLVVPVVCAVAAQWLAPQDPGLQTLIMRLKPPSWLGGDPRFLLGTDGLGRDILSRLIYGARVSLVVGLTVVMIGGSFGTLLGLVSGYLGGVFDSIVMRIVDVFLAFPFLVLALVVMALTGPGLTNVILVLGFTSWVPYARVARAKVLGLKEREFVEASQALAAGPWRVMLRHVLPNIFSSIIVIASSRVATAIVSEATLSFLGLGVGATTPSWGASLADGRTYLLIAWWPATLPGLAIMLTVLAINLIGDGLRDRLDPRIKN